jgi:hypothetical protein
MLLKDFKGNNISFSVTPSMYSDAIEESAKNMSWEDFTILMTESKGLYEKNKSEQLIPVHWKPKDQWVKDDDLALTNSKKTYRNQLNITHVSIAFLDLDEEGSLEQAKAKYAEFDHVIHTTFSGKHRMAIRLDKPIRADAWEACFVHLMAGINGDTQCKNLSRGYLIPSHDLNTDNKPYFEVNKGRALTYDEILALGRKNMTPSSQKMLDKIEDKLDGKDTYGIKRHFSLVEMDYSTYKNDDLSYAKFAKRRGNLIEDCFTKPLKDGARKGERHGFALRAIAAEVMRFKENTDFSKLIQFLFKATQEHDTKPLSYGNTADEIPGMIESSLGQANIEREKILDKDFLRRAKSQIKQGIEISLRAEKDGSWEFTDFSLAKGSYSVTPSSLMSRNSVLVDNYKVEMHTMSAESDNLSSLAMQLFQKNIAKPVIQQELRNNEKASFSSIGRFLLYSMKTLRITGNSDERKAAYDGMTEAYSVGLSKSNLVDSVIGRDMTAQDIKNEFNKGHILEVASEYGGKALFNERNREKAKQREAEPAGYP